MDDTTQHQEPIRLEAIVDYTNLHPFVGKGEIEKLAREAHDAGVRCISIHESRRQEAQKYLRGIESDVGVSPVVGFPFGEQPSDEKARAVKALLMVGIEEVDVVLNIRQLKEGNGAAFADDIAQVLSSDPRSSPYRTRRTVKLAIETGYLMQSEIAVAARMVAGTAKDFPHIKVFVSTSSGFCIPHVGPFPLKMENASLDDVAIIRKSIDDVTGGAYTVGIKAVGRFQDYELRLVMAAAGVCTKSREGAYLVRPGYQDIFRLGTGSLAVVREAAGSFTAAGVERGVQHP